MIDDEMMWKNNGIRLISAIIGFSILKKKIIAVLISSSSLKKISPEF